MSASYINRRAVMPKTRLDRDESVFSGNTLLAAIFVHALLFLAAWYFGIAPHTEAVLFSRSGVASDAMQLSFANREVEEPCQPFTFPVVARQVTCQDELDEEAVPLTPIEASSQPHIDCFDVEQPKIIELPELEAIPTVPTRIHVPVCNNEKQASKEPLPASTAADKGVTVDARILELPSPVYPRISRRRGEEGVVMVKVKITCTGAVHDVICVQGCEYSALNLAALAAAAKAVFQPATCRGKPVESELIIPYRFTLE